MRHLKGFFGITLVITIALCNTFAFAGSEDAGERVMKGIGNLHVPFIANQGQVDERVAFYADTFGGTVFVTKKGEIVYSLPKYEKEEDSDNKAEKAVSHKRRLHEKTRHEKPRSVRGVVLREEIAEGFEPNVAGGEKAETIVNYFKGNDSEQWRSNIPTYKSISLGEIYPGVKLELKAYGNNVEKIFHVEPGIDPSVIQLKLGGATGIQVDEGGELKIETELSPASFTVPVAYQYIDGEKVEVQVSYAIKEPDPLKGEDSLVYGFQVGRYDATKELIIDPLLASTYLGGSGGDSGDAIALDASGNVYVTGYTDSSDFPTTSGAYDTSYNSSGDVFVAKLNSSLTSLQASTYLGGSSNDYGSAIALDTSGNVYVTGATYSSDFPTTSGAYDTSYNSGYYVVFVAKLNSSLTSLQASTYLGGSGGDGGYAIALDTSGNVYVTGDTYSSDFPTTSGAYDTSYNSGGVFVAKLDSSLTSLQASTYLGRSAGGFAIALDTSGNVYVTGYTASSDFPTTSGAYDTSFNSGYYDVFVAKLNSSLTSLQASTYLGGSDYDWGYAIALDTNGNVYVTGNTYSSDFPTTIGAYDTSYNSGDVFVAKLDSSLTSLQASTYLGGSGGDGGNAIALDTSGNVYVTGYTDSSDFPTTSGAYDTSSNPTDVFVAKLDSNLSASTTTPTPTPTPVATIKPTAITDNATNVTSSTATLNGTVNANGSDTTVWFEYGKTSSLYDSSTASQMVTGSGDTSTSTSITGLSAGTTYYYRIVAQNSTGATYGSEVSFTTTTTTSTGTIEAKVSLPQSIYVNKNKKFKAKIKLSSSYDIHDIDCNSVVCDGAQGFDCKVKGNKKLIVYFNNQDLDSAETAGTSGYLQKDLILTGKLTDGTTFEGSDSVWLIFSK